MRLNENELEQISCGAFHADMFLHGICEMFALALNKKFGYQIYVGAEDPETAEYPLQLPFCPFTFLVHVFCCIPTSNKTRRFVDVRGITTNWKDFWEPFEDFSDADTTLIVPVSSGALHSWMKTSISNQEDFDSISLFADKIISQNQSIYQL